ncbi:MAG: sigma-70 family RNA polymerase sigma factor [Phycisphaerales bacterium JB050]
MTRVNVTTRQSATDNLLPMVASGNRASMQDCIDRYGGLVWSLARKFTQSDADAEDATQDIFLDVWKSAARFDPSVASETTFIAMIARRRLIDRRRREARQPKREAMFEDTIAEREAESSQTELSEQAQAASQELHKLSNDQQRVLRLSIFHGLTHERIAEATGMPLGTVKTHARRGLIRLRDLLANRQSASTGSSSGSNGGIRLFPGREVLS